MALGFAKNGILWDSADSSPEQAFDVIRKLNGEIKAQNEYAGGSTFQLQAIEKWLDKHSTSDDHIAPYDRGFGANSWDPGNQNDRKLLYYLNRYCYRCHSTIKFNVYDKVRVKGLAGQIRVRVLDIEDDSVWMPQDRVISGLIDSNEDGIVSEDEVQGEAKEFLELLTRLENE